MVNWTAHTVNNENANLSARKIIVEDHERIQVTVLFWEITRMVNADELHSQEDFENKQDYFLKKVEKEDDVEHY